LEAFQRLAKRLRAAVLNDVPAGERHELGAEVVSETRTMFHRSKPIEFS
jgi:hypothetical protein